MNSGLEIKRQSCWCHKIEEPNGTSGPVKRGNKQSKKGKKDLEE